MRGVVVARARHALRRTERRGVDLRDSRRVSSCSRFAHLLRWLACTALGVAAGCGPRPAPREDGGAALRGDHDGDTEPRSNRDERRHEFAVDVTETKDVDVVERRSTACRAAHVTEDEIAAEVVRAACSDVASLDIPGLVILVRERDGTRFAFAHGSTDLAGAKPVDVNETAFRIGSLTKIVTTWLALEAAADDKLSLDAPLSTYVDDLRGTPAGEVSLRDLLAHRSGLPELEPRDLLLSGTSTWLTRVASFERAQAPRFTYRNVDHALVGEVLRRIYATTWAALVHENAGVGVGLDIHGDLEIEARTSPGHPRWAGTTKRLTVPHREMLRDGPLAAAFTHPAGGLVATAPALADLALALVTSPEETSGFPRRTASLQVSDDTREALLSRTTSADEPCWTLGFACVDRGPSRPPILRHAGNTGDSSAEIWVDPETERVVVVLANAPEFPRNAALAAVQRYLELDPEAVRMAYTRADPEPTGVESPP